MEYYIGEILMFPYSYAPKHFAKCEGQIVRITDNETLFSLLSNRYGGDGITTFALPDLRGAEPIPNVGFYIALKGYYPTRS